MEQSVPHSPAHVDGDVALGFGGRRANMWREDDVRRVTNRVVCGQRLRLIDVERRAAQVAALQRGQQRLIVDDPTASEIGDDGTGAQD